TGITPKVLRPTYGSVNDTIRKNTNLDIVLWNVDTLDWKIKDPKQIANRVIGKVEDGDIVLMHDTHKRTVEALKIILPELKKEGFQFVTVSELKEAQLLRKLDE
ncbi:MAG TPA: polysaccharide deacetylase, partial [[Clostridium] spiroforme]|nr:polysaccharide deacetylase [Thomasclavelia spiroformis]